MPLRRTSHVQRPSHGNKRAFVIQPVHIFRNKVASASTIHDKRVVVPTVPKPPNDFDKFVCAVVTLIMLEMLIASEISARCRISGRYNVPPCAAATEMVQRCELPRKVEGFGEACRTCCNQ